MGLIEGVVMTDNSLHKLADGICKLPNGVMVVITTPHPVNFYWKEGEDDAFIVEGSGVLVNAKPVESVVEEFENHHLVTTKFEGDDSTEKTLRRLHESLPGLIVIGSIVAAQAYPGLVHGLIPAKGFERVPPAEKRMSMDKFNVFGR
jgi:hypothetical protein